MKQKNAQGDVNWQKLGKKLLFCLIASALWAIAVTLRSTLISPQCGIHPELCGVHTLPGFEFFAVGRESPTFNLASFVTQYLSGVLGIVVCVAYFLRTGGTALQNARAFARAFIEGILLFLAVTTANGLINECVRLLVQRPRPFVFAEPLYHGMNPANYTSFYSGHTSFSASQCMMVFLLTSLFLQPSKAGLRALAFALMVMTAAFRVIAGRHFPTDVLAGILGGSLVSLATVRYFVKESA